MTAARAKTGQFLPGNREWEGNGRGRKPVPEDLKGVQLLAPQHVELLLSKMLMWTLAEFNEHMTLPDGTPNPNVSMLDFMVGSVMKKGVIDGDPKYLDFIVNKMLWRDRSEVRSDTVDTVEKLKDVPKETLIAFLKERVRA